MICCNINNAHIFSHCCDAGEKAGGFVHITTEEIPESKFDIVMLVWVMSLPKTILLKKVIKIMFFCAKCLLELYM